MAAKKEIKMKNEVYRKNLIKMKNNNNTEILDSLNCCSKHVKNVYGLQALLFENHHARAIKLLTRIITCGSEIS